MKVVLNILLIAEILFITGCGQPLSKGADDEIIVLAALEDREAAGIILGNIFIDTLFTPVPEPYYKIKYVKPGDMEKIQRHPNIIAISINEDLTNSGTKLVKRILPPGVFEATKRGEQPFILSNNPYAGMQTMLVISSVSTEALRQPIIENRDWIYQQFEDRFTERQSRFLFKRARKKEIEETIFKKYGFGLKIPWGYTIVKDSADAKLFWIGREEPFRWLAIHWEDGMVISDNVEAENYAKNFPKLFFDHIRYTDYKFFVKPYLFNNWSGWRITGTWESIEEPLGGPFISYAFYDGITDRTFYIHTLIFNPGKDKYILLRQLDIIAHSLYVEKNE